MSQSLDENQTCKGMRSLRKGVKVQFTITWLLTPAVTLIGLLEISHKAVKSTNVTFNRSHEEEGIFLFNSA